MDRFDTIALVGFLSLVGATVLFDLEALFLSAALGGFVLSLALWRFYAGEVWEGLGWLAWVGAAVLMAVGIEGRPLLIVAFLGALLVGVALQFGGRFDLLPDVWREGAE
ncbi:hypothetical protein [Natrononativus amylolyticus]|uniref:hypothetical protein n=1 Tax=Natrononativus amylolyticus TaxID=2963434 RepID=UPI0020CE2387|nr:hypothetical protein [Natrononativus amylolyticus]